MIRKIFHFISTDDGEFTKKLLLNFIINNLLLFFYNLHTMANLFDKVIIYLLKVEFTMLVYLELNFLQTLQKANKIWKDFQYGTSKTVFRLTVVIRI